MHEGERLYHPERKICIVQDNLTERYIVVDKSPQLLDHIYVKLFNSKPVILPLSDRKYPFKLQKISTLNEVLIYSM